MAARVAWTHATAELELPVDVIQDNEQGRIELHRKPIGVIGSITPWNWPMLIGSWHIVPAVRTGNTVVIKPSPYTPLSTLRMVELMNEVLPPGVVNVVSGSDSLGAAMSSHPGIQKMVFTGSISTGKKIMAAAAPTLKRLTLELGGNDAGIVLPDADPKAIAPGIFWGAFINGGQTCAALKRLYVHDSIYDAVCSALVEFAKTIPMGDGMDEKTQLGPIQNEMQFNRVTELVEDAKQHGARILCGGAQPARPATSTRSPSSPMSRKACAWSMRSSSVPALPIIRYTDVNSDRRPRQRQPAWSGWFGMELGYGQGQAACAAPGVRHRLGQQARRHPAQRAVWRRQALGHWRGVQRRGLEGIHHRSDGLLLDTPRRRRGRGVLLRPQGGCGHRAVSRQPPPDRHTACRAVNAHDTAPAL